LPRIEHLPPGTKFLEVEGIPVADVLGADKVRSAFNGWSGKPYYEKEFQFPPHRFYPALLYDSSNRQRRRHAFKTQLASEEILGG
jgi:hypothetical protein